MDSKDPQKENKYWLYLEPFVYISQKGETLMFYNTLNGRIEEVLINRECERILNRLVSPSNLRVTEISEHEIKKSAISGIISKLRDSCMGDYFPQEISKKKPIQLIPDMNIIPNSAEMISDQLKRNISEISIYLNGKCAEKCTFCKSYYKQVMHCTKEKAETELNIETVKGFLEEVRHSSIKRINLLGGNISKYSHQDELMGFLTQFATIIRIIIHISNFIGILNKNVLYKNDLVFVTVLINKPIKEESIKEVMIESNKKGIKISFQFLIQNEREYEYFVKMINKLHILDYQILPFYNGDNISFIEENVFLTKEDIIETKPSMRDIFERKTLNGNNFGKLIILGNGDVYANINKISIGNITKLSLSEIITEEIKNGESWFLKRSESYPCCNCNFNLLCPPISNYELVIGKNNLCNMVKNDFNDK